MRRRYQQVTVLPDSDPPAAWYPDPKSQAQLRWWDGEKWTENVHSAPEPG